MGDGQSCRSFGEVRRNRHGVVLGETEGTRNRPRRVRAKGQDSANLAVRAVAAAVALGSVVGTTLEANGDGHVGREDQVILSTVYVSISQGMDGVWEGHTTLAMSTSISSPGETVDWGAGAWMTTLWAAAREASAARTRVHFILSDR